jgi:predicted MFS family arabinose efflux permease
LHCPGFSPEGGTARIRIFRPLRYRNYALFGSSDFIASIGQFVREIALYWLAYEMTGSAIALGILGLCEATPRLALSLIGGVIVDRYDRLRLLTLIQFLCAAPVFIMVFLYFAGVLQFWHMVILELLLSIVRSINPTAGQSMLHDLVPETELTSAVALYSLGFNCARIIGPSLGGLFLLWIDVGGCLTFYGVALLLSAVELLLVRLPDTAPRPPGSNWIADIREGLTYIQNAPLVLSSTLAAYALSTFVGTYQRFLPVFAKDILRVGPEGLGILMGASGLGAVLSLVFLEAVSRRWRPETLLWFSAKATPLLLILFCFSRSLWVSVVLLGLLGAMQILFRTVSRLVIQMEAPRELIGRVMSIFLMDQGLRSVGSMVMGTSVTIFGAALGLSLCSVVSIALTAVTFYRLLGNSSSRIDLRRQRRTFDAADKTPS